MWAGKSGQDAAHKGHPFDVARLEGPKPVLLDQVGQSLGHGSALLDENTDKSFRLAQFQSAGVICLAGWMVPQHSVHLSAKQKRFQRDEDGLALERSGDQAVRQLDPGPQASQIAPGPSLMKENAQAAVV